MANFMLGSARDKTMQAILLNNLESYKDLLDPDFKEKCVDLFLKEYPNDKKGKALAYYNLCYQNLGTYIPSEAIMLDSLSESKREQEMALKIINRIDGKIEEARKTFEDDMESAIAAEEIKKNPDIYEAVKRVGRAIANDENTLIKALATKSKITKNVQDLAAALGKQEQGNKHIEIAKIKNDIIAKEGESVQDLIQLQMKRFNALEAKFSEPALTIDTGFRATVEND
jgi:tetratricopeptide (TPR) repeat protein